MCSALSHAASSAAPASVASTSRRGLATKPQPPAPSSTAKPDAAQHAALLARLASLRQQQQAPGLVVHSQSQQQQSQPRVSPGLVKAASYNSSNDKAINAEKAAAAAIAADATAAANADATNAAAAPALQLTKSTQGDSSSSSSSASSSSSSGDIPTYKPPKAPSSSSNAVIAGALVFAAVSAAGFAIWQTASKVEPGATKPKSSSSSSSSTAATAPPPKVAVAPAAAPVPSTVSSSSAATKAAVAPAKTATPAPASSSTSSSSSAAATQSPVASAAASVLKSAVGAATVVTPTAATTSSSSSSSSAKSAAPAAANTPAPAPAAATVSAFAAEDAAVARAAAAAEHAELERFLDLYFALKSETEASAALARHKQRLLGALQQMNADLQTRTNERRAAIEAYARNAAAGASSSTQQALAAAAATIHMPSAAATATGADGTATGADATGAGAADVDELTMRAHSEAVRLTHAVRITEQAERSAALALLNEHEAKATRLLHDELARREAAWAAFAEQFAAERATQINAAHAVDSAHHLEVRVAQFAKVAADEYRAKLARQEQEWAAKFHAERTQRLAKLQDLETRVAAFDQVFHWQTQFESVSSQVRDSSTIWKFFIALLCGLGTCLIYACLYNCSRLILDVCLCSHIFLYVNMISLSIYLCPFPSWRACNSR